MPAHGHTTVWGTHIAFLAMTHDRPSLEKVLPTMPSKKGCETMKD